MREVINLALLDQQVDDALDLTVKEDKKPVLN
jgi:ATP-dependent Lon protease